MMFRFQILSQDHLLKSKTIACSGTPFAPSRPSEFFQIRAGRRAQTRSY
jgi:hypothetical protein